MITIQTRDKLSHYKRVGDRLRKFLREGSRG